MRRMLVAALAACVTIILAGPATAQTEGDGLHPRVKMETTLGDIVLELDAQKAPICVDNFIQYAESGFYKGTIFHRVIKTFMIQGGGYTADMEEKSPGRPGIKNEYYNGLKNDRGTIAMARLGQQPHSATAQFFINVVDNAMLDVPRDGAAYAVFGKVVEGLDVVDKIRDTKLIKHPKYPAQQACTPETAVEIKSVTMIGPYDKAKVADLKTASEKLVAEFEADPLKLQNKLAESWIQEAEAAGAGKVETTPSGLRYVTVKAGDGPTPPAGAKVEVHYTGWLVYGEGSKFDSSVDRKEPFQFSLSGGVIQGWLEGVASMKVGEKRRLIIPPQLGWGARGAGRDIPPNSVLVFDVELLGIK